MTRREPGETFGGSSRMRWFIEYAAVVYERSPFLALRGLREHGADLDDRYQTFSHSEPFVFVNGHVGIGMMKLHVLIKLRQ